MSLSTDSSVDFVTGNGSKLKYPYTFLINDDDELVVTVRDPDTGDETVLTKTTHYAVSSVGTVSGGNVVFVDGAFDWIDTSTFKQDWVASFRRVVALTQQTSIRNQSAFYPETHEDAFDYAMMVDQQQQEEIDRSFKFGPTVNPGSANDFDTTFPAELIGQADMTLATNATGDGFAVGPSVATIDAAIAAGTAAAASATAADASADLAEEWATKITGTVTGSSEYAAKAWAIGGTGVTDTASRGAAKEWAIETASTVDGTDYSAKEWAKGTQTRGAASGGSAKDWATYVGGTVDDTEYSAKYYANLASGGVSSNLGVDVSFKVFGDSPVTLVSADRGKIISCDCTGGNISITLPDIASLSLASPFSFVIKKTDSSANTVTINRASTDTIDGATSVTISSQYEGVFLFAEDSVTPDQWSMVKFGSAPAAVTSFSDSAFEITDNVDVTKILKLEVSGVTTGTTRTLTVPNANTTIVGTDFAQVITLKDIDGGTATNTSRITIPKATKATLDGLTRKQATIVFATDTLVPYVDNGSVLVPIGSGGGGSISFNDNGPNAPVASVENNQEVYLFESGLSQTLYAVVKVPTSYAGGTQISMKIGHYSPSSSNTILLSSVTTLIRAGTDAMTSTTNQRTSTNAALTNTVANQLRVASLDLTSSTGTVNSVAVSGGDLLLVALSRGTDSDTADIRFIPSSIEVTFV